MIDPRDVALMLLSQRAAGATVCPSEVARALAAASIGTGTGTVAGDWRTLMPEVHAAVDGLVREGAVRLSWKGEAMATRSGPYRIGRAPPDVSG